MAPGQKKAVDVLYKSCIVILAVAAVTTMAWKTIAAPQINEQVKAIVATEVKPIADVMNKNDTDHKAIRDEIADLKLAVIAGMTPEQRREYRHEMMGRRR